MAPLVAMAESESEVQKVVAHANLAAAHGVLDVLGRARARDQDRVGAKVERLLDADAVVRAADAHHGLRAARTQNGKDCTIQCALDGALRPAGRRNAFLTHASITLFAVGSVLWSCELTGSDPATKGMVRRKNMVRKKHGPASTARCVFIGVLAVFFFCCSLRPGGKLPAS